MAERGRKYGPLVREMDERADVADLRACAQGYREEYNRIPKGDRRYYKAVADAAFCASLAERKARRG